MTFPEKVRRISGWDWLFVLIVTVRVMGPVAAGPWAFGSKFTRRTAVSPAGIVSERLDDPPPCPIMPFSPLLLPSGWTICAVVHMQDVSRLVTAMGTLESFARLMDFTAMPLDMGTLPKSHEGSETVSSAFSTGPATGADEEIGR